MGSLKRLLAAVFLGLSGLVLVPPPAFACSCVESSVQEHLSHSDVVVTGTIDDVTGSLSLVDTGSKTYRFHVEAVHKGEVPEWIDVETGGPCGIDYDLPTRTVFFLARAGGDFDAGLCGGSGNYAPAEVAAVAGPGTPPRPGGPGPHPVLAEYAGVAGVGGGGALVLLTAFLWLRMRKD